jgi:hypothetical protein
MATTQLDISDKFVIEECASAATASLSDIHECFERGEPLSLLVLSRVEDPGCEFLLEEWLEHDVVTIANVNAMSPNWSKQLIAHFHHAASFGISAIEYRLWSVESNIIKMDARLLRYI